MRKLYLLLLLAVFSGSLLAQPGHDVECATGQQCWAILEAGNTRWVNIKDKPPERPNQTWERREELKPGRKQKPFAAIVSCSDSRVPPELVFDRGLGDLFIVRVAGNIVDKFALGSIQYAVAALGVKLVVVMGHQDCGAVNAALKFPGETPKEPLLSLVKEILPARREAARRWGEPVTLDNAIDANVYLMTPKIESMLRGLGLKAVVLGKRYNLDGEVRDLKQ